MDSYGSVPRFSRSSRVRFDYAWLLLLSTCCLFWIALRLTANHMPFTTLADHKIDLVRATLDRLQEANPHARFKHSNRVLNLTPLQLKGRLHTTNDFPISWFDPLTHSATERLNFSSTLPEEFDWSDYGALTAVKTQGNFGSCFAESAAQTVESAHFLKYGKLHRVSVTQPLTCMKTECDFTELGFRCCFDGDCNYFSPYRKEGGGHPADCFRFWFHHGYIQSFYSPYYYAICEHETKEATCLSRDFCIWEAERCTPHFAKTCVEPLVEDSTLGKVKEMIWVSLSKSTIINLLVPDDSRIAEDEEIKTALYQLGPLSIALNADYMQFYESGVMTIIPEGELNHALQLVGWGTATFESGVSIDYWKIRNSWGPEWGESGHVRIARTRLGSRGLKDMIMGVLVE